MDALHARYPFLDDARAAVEAADVDLADAIDGGGPIVERARERVTLAIDEGRVGSPNRSVRTELLSYPVARVLVSLVDEPGLTRRYAQSEADTAYERFTADVEDDVELRSVNRATIDLDRLLREFDVSATAEMPMGPTDARSLDRFPVALGRYLALADGLADDRWRLVNRTVAGGTVAVSRTELYELLREAIRVRVEDGLPLSVPEPIVDALADDVATIRERLADPDLPIPNAVEPDLFPPCVMALRERASSGGDLPDHSRFVLTSFLVTIGMEPDDVVAEFEGDPEAVRKQVAHLREGDAAEYPPPSCATMQAYGDCVNMDALCETIAHPLEYYEKRLRGADPDQLVRPESQ